VVKTLANVLRHLVSLVENLSLRHVTVGVAKILLDQKASTQEGQHVYHLTQQELAVLVGMAHEVVGRVLKKVEATGAIEMCQGRAVVVNPERLRMLSSG
jgi:CRP-like cAMP-binding protein